MNKCKECGFTSFVHKGFFDISRYKIKPPTQEDFSEKLWKATYQYGELKPRERYGSEEYIKKPLDNDKYKVIEEPEKV